MGRCLQQAKVVSVFLCGTSSCKRWFEISTCESGWIYTELELLWIQFEALFSFETMDECFQKHSLDSWVRMMRFHRSWRFLDSWWECESDGDGIGISVSIPDVASNIRVVYEALWLPLASMWDTPALWGQCLRTVFNIWVGDLEVWYSGIVRKCLRIVVNLWVFDLEVYFVTFIFVTYCWRLVIVVSELL